MKTAKELLKEILDLTEQAIAIRKTMTLDMPRHVFQMLNNASLDLMTEAEKLVDDLEEANAAALDWQQAADRLIAKAAINRVLEGRVKSTWNN
jgi:uncharacterized protein Yka (UPF0111/DUF47 family)